MQDMFDKRELAVMSMALLTYINLPDCPEKPAVKDELREIIRKIDAMIEKE